MLSYFQLLETLRSTDNGQHKVDLPDNWRQGRTLYGGLTAALCYEAARRDMPDLAPLRSLQVSFIGPVTDNPQITTRCLRRGRNVTAMQSDMFIGEQIVASANMLFGQSRDSELRYDCPTPKASLPEDAEPFFPAAAEPFLPAYVQNFDLRLIEGHRPASSDEESRAGLGSFIAIGDVMPPAALPMFTQMGPVSSMNWQVNILNDTCASDDGWWHIELDLTASRDGYSSQIMRYWNRAGVLCAEAIQSVTIFI